MDGIGRMEDLAKEGKLFLFAIVVAIMVSVFFFFLFCSFQVRIYVRCFLFFKKRIFNLFDV